MKPGNVNSHIQMPRFLLARFENNNHSFFYYDVEKDYIGTKGHARSINTEFGYYPEKIEKFLSNQIEQPFSNIVKFIDALDLEKPHFLMTTAIEYEIKQFMISLIIRSPLFINSIKNTSVFFQFLGKTDQRTIAISGGIATAQEQRIFNDFRATLTLNKSAMPFLLPICGIYSYMMNGYNHINLPVSPEIAITLIESAGIPSIKKEGIMGMYQIDQEDQAIQLNGFAFRQQCKQQYGYIISPTKDALTEQLARLK